MAESTLAIPALCLVLLVGASGSGKSTFARRHFLPTEVVSSDACRAMLVDDENDQSITPDAFALVHHIVGERLRLGRLTVVDATSVKVSARKELIALAKRHDVHCGALVLDLDEDVLVARHALRRDRPFAADVIRRQRLELHRSIHGLAREGLRFVHVLTTPEQVDAATIRRTRLPVDRRTEAGPFDIVGDVHGCLDELFELCGVLGYVVGKDGDGWTVHHPDGRRLVFVGDLVDRGPDSPGVVRFVRSVVRSGAGYCVAGNHDAKLARALRGRNVAIGHGLERSLDQLRDTDPATRDAIAGFLEGLASHYVFDGGRLVVAHAGLVEALQGRSAGRVRSFAMYGQTTGETDGFGLPIRYEWARDYRGPALVAYGHTPVLAAEWVNNTICLDTGCVFGGRLTALRYPERELASVAARREYYPPARPLAMRGADDARSTAPDPGSTGTTCRVS